MNFKRKYVPHRCGSVIRFQNVCRMSGAIMDSRKRSCSTLSTSFYVTSYVDQKFKVEAIQVSYILQQDRRVGARIRPPLIPLHISVLPAMFAALPVEFGVRALV